MFASFQGAREGEEGGGVTQTPFEAQRKTNIVLSPKIVRLTYVHSNMQHIRTVRIYAVTGGIRQKSPRFFSLLAAFFFTLG